MVSRTVERAAEAVADGARVDWDEVQRLLADAPDKTIADGLRTISQLAESTSASRAVPTEVSGTASMHPLLKLVVLLAAIQAALGALGAVSGAAEPSPGGSLAAVSAAFALTGVWLLAGATADRRAAYLAGFFVTVAAAFAYSLTLRLIPFFPSHLSSAFFWRGLRAETFFPLFLWLFIAEFPRVVRLGRADRALRWGTRTAASAGAVLFLANLAASLRQEQPHTDPQLGWLTRSPDAAVYWLIPFGLMLFALVTAWKRRRDASASERRRVTLFIGALVAGFAPALAYVLLSLLVPAFDHWTRDPAVMKWVLHVTHASLITMPLVTAYAAVAQHIFDVRWAVGRVAQHLLLRSTLTVVTIAPAAGLCVLLYSHRSLPLDEILALPTSKALLALTLASAMTLAFRRQLQHAVDRHFLRQQVDLETRLAEVSSRLQSADTVESVGLLLISEVKTTFQLERATLLMRSRDDGALYSIDGGARSLEEPSALSAIIAPQSGPVVVEPLAPRSAFALLPETDRHWVLDSGATVMASLSDAPDGAHQWLLSLGRKRSGHHFAPAELRFLHTLALTAGLALENRRLRQSGEPDLLAVARDQPAQVCVECGRAFVADAVRCSCGSELTAAALPYELNQKFRLHRLLGHGGMGVVYEAEDLTLGRGVALKTLPHLSAEYSLRLRIEARAMASVTHPHLALIHGAESWRGVPVLVLELLEGDTLARRIAPHGLPPTEVVNLGVALAGALETMHRRGLLHRDIKPTNVAFDAEDTPKLLDFGLAHLLEKSLAQLSPSPTPFESGVDVTATGHVMGTPLYLSPEAATGAAASPAHDLWSLALVLYECVVGPAMLRRVMGAFRPEIRGAVLPSCREYQADCPESLASFLANALSPDPRQRPPTASAFAAGLHGAAPSPG